MLLPGPHPPSPQVHNCDDAPFTFTTGLRAHFATKDIPSNRKTVRTLGLFGAPPVHLCCRRAATLSQPLCPHPCSFSTCPS